MQLYFLLTFLPISLHSLKPFEQPGCVALYDGPITKEQGKLDLKCYMPTKAGHCYGYYESYYYSVKEARCILSAYGGCGGCYTFETKEKCKVTCEKEKTFKPRVKILEAFSQKGCDVNITNKVADKYQKLPTVCFIKTKVGKCGQLKDSYHFDYTKSKCVKASFGGCDDGCLGFGSIKECEDTCINIDKE